MASGKMQAKLTKKFQIKCIYLKRNFYFTVLDEF